MKFIEVNDTETGAEIIVNAAHVAYAIVATDDMGMVARIGLSDGDTVLTARLDDDGYAAVRSLLYPDARSES